MEFRIAFPGGLRVDAELDGRVIATDQPAKAGGGGEAPSPFLLFLASIGTCAGYYVLQFCRTRAIPTDGVRLIQRVEKDEKGLVSRIDLVIEVPPTFPEQYRAAVAKAADQCAVKRALEFPPDIEVTVTTSG
jgi:putative redox protein